MCRIMSKRCSGNHQHARLEGGSRCKKAENYQSELAWNRARALLEDEGLSEQAYAVQPDAEAVRIAELTGVLRKLGTKHGSEAIAYHLHRNLGILERTSWSACCRPRMPVQLKPLSAHTATSFLH